MCKITINFRIQSLDTNNHFICVGELKNNRIKFIDNENNTNYIIYHQDSIEYRKIGTIDMKYKFNLREKTQGYYALNGYKLHFDIRTEQILETDSLLNIKYDLYQNDDLVNKTEILLEYTFLKEE